jgi:hypothetical protein
MAARLDRPLAEAFSDSPNGTLLFISKGHQSDAFVSFIFKAVYSYDLRMDAALGTKFKRVGRQRNVD